MQLGPYHLDTFMDGIMLIFTHRDVPGIIGYIGTIFGKHQVNIAQMTVGRQVRGGRGDRRAQPGSTAAGSGRAGGAGPIRRSAAWRGEAAAGRGDAAMVKLEDSHAGCLGRTWPR